MRTGITRKVDDLGRVVIPAGIRRSLDMREGETVEVAVEGDQVILFKPVDECVFCGEEAGLRAFRGKSVCRSCVAAVGVLDDSLRDKPPEAPVEGERDLPPWPVEDGSGRQRGAGRGAGTAAERGASREDTRPEVSAPRQRSSSPAESTDPASRKQRSSASTGPSNGAPEAPSDAGRGRDDSGDQEPPASTTAW